MKRILKTVTYKCSSLLLTVCIAYLLTREILIATAIGIVDFVVTFAWYYMHELLWEKINGRCK